MFLKVLLIFADGFRLCEGSRLVHEFLGIVTVYCNCDQLGFLTASAKTGNSGLRLLPTVQGDFYFVDLYFSVYNDIDLQKIL